LLIILSKPFDKPHQPRRLGYPTRTFGKKNPEKWTFRAVWFEEWRWLHYDEASDIAFFSFVMKQRQKEN